MRVFDPARTTSSTPREMTRLLGLIWRDEAGPAAACALVRGLMARQLFWTRLASGFPADVRVAGKTGTLPGLQMEAGVAEYPTAAGTPRGLRARRGSTARPRTGAGRGPRTAAAAADFAADGVTRR